MAEMNSRGKSAWYHDYRWMILIIMFFGSILNYLDRVNLSIANTTIANEFGLGPVEMGHLLSAFMWSYALANLPAGWLLDKYGIKSIFLWSTIAWSIATIAGGFARGFASMYVVRLILGIAEAPFFICAAQFTKAYFAENERGTASSLINMGPKIANGFSPPVLTFMLISLGWRSMFISLGVVGFLLAVAWLKYYREDTELFPQADINAVREDSRAKAGYLAILKHPTTWWFNLGNIGSSYVFWLYFTWLPTYLTTERGMTLTQAGWAAMIPFIAGVAAVPIGGYMSDYLIRKGMNLIRARLVPTVGGCLLAAVAVAPLNYVHDTGMAVLLMTISLFAGALRVGVLWALVGDIAPPEGVGSLGGIQNFANFVGAALAPIGTGYILKATGSYDHVFTVSAILCALGALSYMMIKRKITTEDLLIGSGTEQAGRK
jgi:sugar phosphate permease